MMMQGSSIACPCAPRDIVSITEARSRRRAALERPTNRTYAYVARVVGGMTQSRACCLLSRQQPVRAKAPV